MKKINIVKDNRDFNRIIKENKYYKNENYIIYLSSSNKQNYRFGISVGKKLGNAVVRNKLKRQTRNIIDKYKNSYENNKDYIIIIRKNCIDLDFQTKTNSFKELIDKINSKEKRNNEK